MASPLKLLLPLILLLGSCTVQHSKQALRANLAHAPSAEATFVSEEDSGLSLFGLVVLYEPDHYAVLVERARRRFNCGQLHSMQLDFFSEHWLIVAFPIARITAVCEPAAAAHPASVRTSTTS